MQLSTFYSFSAEKKLIAPSDRKKAFPSFNFLMAKLIEANLLLADEQNRWTAQP